jgi:putative ABC transport system permease protein
MGLGVMLVVAVLSIHGIIAQSFRNNASLGYNMIVGAKGGQEQLTLNTVYYLSRPVENIPYTYYLEFLQREERVRQAESYAAQALDALNESQALLNLAAGGTAAAAEQRIVDRLGLSLVPDTRIKPHFPPVETGRHGKYGQMTNLAIPLCLGDYYGRFRVVGTTQRYSTTWCGISTTIASSNSPRGATSNGTTKRTNISRRSSARPWPAKWT